MTTKIALIDHTGTIPAAELWATAHALQYQVQHHFALPPPLGYGTSATIRVVVAPDQPKADEWVIGLFTEPDQPGALGYHDVTASGLPLMKIFPLLDAQDGVSWSSTASHEVLETLADPECCRATQDPHGKFWALEVCDGVEADSYKIHGIEVSNFALPPYFEPPSSLAGVKLDYLGLCKVPMETRPGGYNQWFGTGGWHQVTAEKAPRGARSNPAAMAHGRRAKRAGKFKSE